MKNLRRSIALFLAAIMIMSSFAVMNNTDAQAASVKLNKTSATIYVGGTVKLTLSGSKNTTWKSSNGAVATVNKWGTVTGKKAGKATITATNKKTKKSYKCNITVKATQKFAFTANNLKVSINGYFISYPGKAIYNAAYTLDGKKLTKANSTVAYVAEENRTYVYLKNQLTTGHHTFAITKTGFTTITLKFSYTRLVLNGLFVDDESLMCSDGILYLVLNPAPFATVQSSDIHFYIDGVEVQNAMDVYTSHDQFIIVCFDANALGSGTHSVTVSCTGYANETQTITLP